MKIQYCTYSLVSSSYPVFQCCKQFQRSCSLFQRATLNKLGRAWGQGKHIRHSVVDIISLCHPQVTYPCSILNNFIREGDRQREREKERDSERERGGGEQMRKLERDAVRSLKPNSTGTNTNTTNVASYSGPTQFLNVAR